MESSEPELLEINQETEAKTPSKIAPEISTDGTQEIIKWTMEDIPKGKTYRIEW